MSYKIARCCLRLPATSPRDYPWSLSGTALQGDKLVRLIYLDESGISAKETVTVVAGVIINADQQWKAVAQHIRGLIEKYVPEQYQEGFSFHGKDLFHGSGRTPFDRRYYPANQAHSILKQLLHVPGKFRLPVVFGYCTKGHWRSFLSVTSQDEP